MSLTVTHRHRWSADHICFGCGLTRGRASRIDGDLATIERFLNSADTQSVLMKLDPVAFATTISGMRAAARERHDKAIKAATKAKLEADKEVLLKEMAKKMAAPSISLKKVKKTPAIAIKVDADISDVIPIDSGFTVTITEEV